MLKKIIDEKWVEGARAWIGFSGRPIVRANGQLSSGPMRRRTKGSDGGLFSTAGRQQMDKGEGRTNLRASRFIIATDRRARLYRRAFACHRRPSAKEAPRRGVSRAPTTIIPRSSARPLCDRLAEAFAEHMQLARAGGASSGGLYRGRKHSAMKTSSPKNIAASAPAPGYPMQPDHTEKADFGSNLLDAARAAPRPGMQLTEKASPWLAGLIRLPAFYFSLIPDFRIFRRPVRNRSRSSRRLRRAAKGWELPAKAERLGSRPILAYEAGCAPERGVKKSFGCSPRLAGGCCRTQ